MCTQAYFCRFSLGMKPRMGNPKDYVHRRSSHSSNIVGLATSHQRRRSQPTFCQSIIVYKYLSARTNNKLVSIRQDIDSGHHYQIISPQASERSRLRTISLPLALSLSLPDHANTSRFHQDVGFQRRRNYDTFRFDYDIRS